MAWPGRNDSKLAKLAGGVVELLGGGTVPTFPCCAGP